MIKNKCSTCGAAIIWARTHKGKLAPFDAAPSTDGAWALTRDLFELCAQKSSATGTDLYVSHFATCPDAPLHRTKK